MNLKELLNLDKNQTIIIFGIDIMSVPLNSVIFGLSLAIEIKELKEKGKITEEESDSISDLILSGDKENLELAKQLIIGKRKF